MYLKYIIKCSKINVIKKVFNIITRTFKYLTTLSKSVIVVHEGFNLMQNIFKKDPLIILRKNKTIALPLTKKYDPMNCISTIK